MNDENDPDRRVAEDSDKPQGDAASTASTFTVTRSGDTSGETTVQYAVTGGTADAGTFAGAPFGVVTSSAADDGTDIVRILFSNGSGLLAGDFGNRIVVTQRGEYLPATSRTPTPPS